MVTEPGGGVPSSVITRPETYMGRDMPGKLLGAVLEDGVVVVGEVVVVDGVVLVVPRPGDVPDPLACPSRETQQAVVRKKIRAEFRIGILRIKAGFIMPRERRFAVRQRWRTDGTSRMQPVNLFYDFGMKRRAIQSKETEAGRFGRGRFECLPKEDQRNTLFERL